MVWSAGGSDDPYFHGTVFAERIEADAVICFQRHFDELSVHGFPAFFIQAAFKNTILYALSEVFQSVSNFISSFCIGNIIAD